MQIIIFCLIIASALGQHNCDFKEIEGECYNQICEISNPQNLILSDSTELKKAVENHPYKLPKKVSDDFKILKTYTDAVKDAGRNAIKKNTFKDVAKEIVSDPIDGLDRMEDFFKDDFNCVTKNHKCQLIVNNMTSYPPGAKELFKKLNDGVYFFLDGDTLPVPEKKKLLEEALFKLKGQMPPKKYQDEQKKIGAIKKNDEYVVYTYDLKWLEDYKKKLSKELLPYQADLQLALEIKTKALIDLDVSSPKAEASLSHSCRHASYVSEKIHSVSSKNFSDLKAKMLTSFKGTFLPKLSKESAITLGERITKLKIVMVETETSFEPELKHVDVREGKYEESKEYLLQELASITKSANFRCKLQAKPQNSFLGNDDGILIATTTVAFGSSDILNHEVGHWLHQEIKRGNLSKHSLEKLEKVMTCVKDFYPQDPLGSKVAEDFADWFITQMGGGENQVFCDISKMMKTHNFRGMPLYYSKDKEPHSNNLFRELHLRLEKGVKLSQSCKDLIDAHPEARPGKCEF